MLAALRNLHLPEGLRREAPIVLLMFVLAAAVGMAYIANRPALGFFYQTNFGPAISIAVGEGYQDVTGPAEVTRFLNARRGALDPGALEKLTFRPYNRFQRNHFYLISAVGLFWRYFGISWEALLPFFGLLYAISISSMYGLFRLAAPRILAIPATFIMLLSPLHLTYLGALRDYSKAPILLLGMLLLGLLVRMSYRRWKVICIAILAGVLVGMGRGFRLDALLIAPAFFVVLLLFTPAGWRRNLGSKLIAAAAFVVAAWTMLQTFPERVPGASEGAAFHVVALGFAANLYPQLGLDPSIYEHGYKLSSDEVQTAIIADYNERRGGVSDVAYQQPNYQRASANYVGALVRHFPADVLVRGYASVRTIVDELAYGAALPGGTTALYVEHPFVVWLYELRGGLAGALRGTGVFWLAGAALVLGVANLRWLLAFLFLFAYFAGTSILQFHVRHVFHLEALAWLCLVIVLAGVAHAIARYTLAHGEERPKFPWRRWVYSASGIAVVVAACWGTLYAARVYQQMHLTKLIEEGYLALPLKPLEVEVTALGETGRRLLRFPALAPEPAGGPTDEMWEDTQYLVIDLEHPTSAPERVVPFVLRYAGEGPKQLTRAFRIRLAPRPAGSVTRVYIPAYYFKVRHVREAFVGIEADAALVPFFEKAYVAREIEDVPFLMTLVLPDNWRQWPLYERFSNWDGSRLFRPVTHHAPTFHSPERRLIPPFF